MRRDGTPIQTLLLRTFLPAVVVVAMLLAILVYNWLYASIIDGFERKLVTTSALVGALVDPADHDALIRQASAHADPEATEKGAQYARNVEPIRRIRRELDLTYLYSQVIGGSQDVIYVLDGSLGDNHSPIGAEDTLGQGTLAGVKRVQARRTVYVSPIEYQEQWGLLKTAAAPLYGADGRVAATAGADVNISVIQVATQNALFASALIGIGSILACVMVALVIVRRVARPISALKQEALRIAAGDDSLPAPLGGPREVGKLRDALAALATEMAAAATRDGEAAARRDREADAALLSGEQSLPPPAAEAPSPAETVGRADPGEPAPGQAIGAETVRHLLALRRIAPFDALTESELLLVAGHVHFRRFTPGAILLAGGSVAEMLFVVVAGQVAVDGGPAPAIFDAQSALFGLPARADYRAGPDGAAALCLAKPHLFTIARECPDFIVGLATGDARLPAEAAA